MTGIYIEKISIHNFRSLKCVELELGTTSVLVGQNNSGKSNFLKAINLAIGNDRQVSENDIFIEKDEKLTYDKTATIDILIKPLGITKRFSNFWMGVFTDSWIMTDETEGSFVGIRTIIEFDEFRREYVIKKIPIQEWDSSGKIKIGRNKIYNLEMKKYITSFYMDAQRDIIKDLNDRRSYFGRATSQTEISKKTIEEIECQLNEINEKIIKSIPMLQELTHRMSNIDKTLGADFSKVEIEPVARKITDIHKGMDITITGKDAAKFSIDQQGSGTRSWISFLTLGEYVNWHSNNIKLHDAEADCFIVLTMEEPEAHLHPQAQKQLYSELIKFTGQKLISTHSSSIVLQCDLSNIIHFEKTNGETTTSKIDLSEFDEKDLKKVHREVIRTKGEILFSRAIVLCEGISEEQAIPVFFKEYFNKETVFCGIDIVEVSGRNYKPFLLLAKIFKIPWYIFSDGEKDTTDNLKKIISKMFDKAYVECANIIILENLECYEQHLIANGYTELMISAICEVENNHDYFRQEISKANGDCELALSNFFNKKRNAKAMYALPIAEKIVKNAKNKIPPKIKELFSKISSDMDSDGVEKE